MGLDATARRRLLGALTLAIALGMLLVGDTFLKNRLSPIGFLAYWLVCLVLTSLAILAAFLDVRDLQKRSRKEQRDLFESTLRKIEEEAQNKARPGKHRSKQESH